MEEAEHIEDGANLPDALVVFPPVNANDDVTDEDSGDDENVIMDNLPGSLLDSQAEPVFYADVVNIGEEGSEDSDDDIPLSTFMKYKKKRKNNDWVQEDMISKLPSWADESVANINFLPLDLFYMFFDEELWQMITYYIYKPLCSTT